MSKNVHVKEPTAAAGEAAEGAVDAAQPPQLPAEPDPSAVEDPISVLKAQVAALEEEKRLASDRFLRSAAELENFKKRTEREVNDFRRYANEAILKDLLPAVDNLERAVAAADGRDGGAGSAILAGVDLTLKEIRKVFERHAVKPIDAAGQAFDPTLHQAVLQEESDAHPENTVIREFQKGYRIHDRLLRPAMVVVAKAVEKRPADAEPQG
jgi:molecular chaperone GrpE